MTDRNKVEIANPEGEEVSLGRRSALMKLGLATIAVYAVPALLTLSEAEAGKRSGRRSGKNRRSGRRTGRRSRRSRRSS